MCIYDSCNSVIHRDFWMRMIPLQKMVILIVRYYCVLGVIMCCMYLLQTGDGDRAVTVTEEPASVKDTKDIKVNVVVSLLQCVYLLFVQGEKCFCAKGDKCPSIGETASSDHDGREIVEVCMVLM